MPFPFRRPHNSRLQSLDVLIQVQKLIPALVKVRTDLRNCLSEIELVWVSFSLLTPQVLLKGDFAFPKAARVHGVDVVAAIFAEALKVQTLASIRLHLFTVFLVNGDCLEL